MTPTPRTKRFLLVAALMLGLVATPTILEAATSTQPHLNAADGGVVVRGGPIRLGSHVYARTNATHAIPGIKRITTSRCRLTVYFDSSPHERIVSATAEEDETMAKMGVMAGSSGTQRHLQISLFRNGKRVCPTDKRFTKYANIWLTVITAKS